MNIVISLTAINPTTEAATHLSVDLKPNKW